METTSVALETLLELLRAGREMPGIADPSAVTALVGEVARDMDRQPGVGSLMRLWDGSMPRRRADQHLTTDELDFMARWFGDLSDYLLGVMPAASVARLVDFHSASNWMPALSSAFAGKLEERLRESMPSPVAAAADAVPQVATEQAPLESVASAPAFESIPEAFAPAAFDQSVASDIEDAPVAAHSDQPSGPGDHEEHHVEDGAFAFTTEHHSEDAAFASDGDAAFGGDSAFGDAWPAPHAAAPADVGDHGVEAFEFAAPAPAQSTAANVVIGHVETHSNDDILFAADAPAEISDEDIIWISEDERHLTLQAINEQLLPLAQQWAIDGPTQDILEEIGYQGDLVVNVLDLVGTTTLAEGMRHVLQAVAPPTPACDGQGFADWCTGLLASLEMPGADTAELLAVMGLPLGLDMEWGERLQAELARVRIGISPAQRAELHREITEEDLRLTPADDVLPAVLDGMLRELPGNVSKLGHAIRAVVDEGDLTPLDEARRVAHTLKGDANTVGVRGLATLTHSMEDILVELVKAGRAPNQRTGELLTLATDTVDEIADHLLGRGPAPDIAEVCAQVAGFNAALQEDPELATRPDADMPEPLHTATNVHEASSQPAAAAATVAAAPEQAAGAAAQRTLTLDSGMLDGIQDLAGESMVTSRRIDLMLANIANAYRDQTQAAQNAQLLLEKLDDLVALRGAALQSTAQRGDVELDPLEIDQYNELHVISRQLAENQADTQDSLRNLERNFRALSELRSVQETINLDLQRSILRTRLVPFSQVSARLQRIARQTAKQVMKPVTLHVHGEEALLDAELLERVVEPLGHLLRNAIDHGIETPNIRQVAGKPEQAEIRLDVAIHGDSAHIDLRDDGRGLDLHAIRRKAIDMGLLQPGEDINDAALTRMILLPGFSTREQTTELSGRGVGMDVVNRRVLDMRGSLQLHSEAGKGLHVQLRLPVSATIANVIVVHSKRHTTAVVAGAVQSIVQLQGSDISYDDTLGRMTAMIAGVHLDAMPMDTLYGDNIDIAELREKGSIGLLVQVGAATPMVVLVDSVADVNSVIVKPISPDIPPIPAVRGLAQLADGRLAPVTDLDQLINRTGGDSLSHRVASGSHVQQTRVLVADDSLSVRRSMQQLMEDAGYEVVTASDGLEALAQVEARPVAAFLLDMEMPRMNGLELSRALRVREDSKHVPIIMITSRSSDKHREMALEAGVDVVLTKPVADDDLTALVGRMVTEAARL